MNQNIFVPPKIYGFIYFRRMAMFGLLIPLLVGCGIPESIRGAVNTLDSAIYALSSESANWRSIVEEIKDELPAEIRGEVDIALNRALAASGVEFRCDVDFIRQRLRQDLLDIRDQLIGKKQRIKTPVICHVIPATIDPMSTKYVQFFGYDFDKSQLELFLEDGNQVRNVTELLDRPSHYELTINVSHALLSDTSRKFILRGGTEEYSVAIKTARRAKVKVTFHSIYVENGGGECPAEVYFDLRVNGQQDPNPWGKQQTERNETTIPDCGTTVNLGRWTSLELEENDTLSIAVDMQEKDDNYHLAAFHHKKFLGSQEWNSARGDIIEWSQQPQSDFGDGRFKVTYSIDVEWLN